MNHEEFLESVEKMRADKEHYSNVVITESIDNAEDPDVCKDSVEFTLSYLSLDELSTVTKRLRMSRFHTPDVAMMDGKVSFCEQIKCETCGHEDWKNVTKEVGAKLLGGSIRGW